MEVIPICEFCTQHGEGKTWYLQAKNYSDDLLSDLRRRRFVADFYGHPEELARDVDKLGRLDKVPGFVQRVLKWHINRSLKKVHFGQVVPIEDVERIFDFVTSVTRMACMCRHVKFGTEHRYCYAISVAPSGGQFLEVIRRIDPSYLFGPGASGLETLSKDEAIAAFRQHEREGLCHTVWSYIPPFIGSFCNCDQSACLAMRATRMHTTSALFRAEYVGRVDSVLCNGCRACMRVCPFGALVDAATKKVAIDPRQCYGCGICRTACKEDAIRLESRAKKQESARIW